MVNWFIATKYISSRFITFAAFLLISLGVAILIILLAVMEGFKTEMVSRIRGISSDLKVESTRTVGMDSYPEVQRLIGEVSGVRAIVPFVDTLVLYTLDVPMGIPRRSGHLSLHAFDLLEEAKVGELEQYVRNYAGDKDYRRLRLPGDVAGTLSREWIEKGLWESVGRSPPPNIGELKPVILGAETFPFAPLLLGATIELQTISPVTVELRTQQFILAGYLRTKDVLFDTQAILMDVEDVKDFLGLQHPETAKAHISGLRVFLEKNYDYNQAKDEIESAVNASGIPFIKVQTWREEKQKVLRAVETEKALVGIILGVIILFVGLMVFIILTVQVVEKTKDLGVLQSVGLTASGVIGIYVRVGGVICAAGIALGALYGVLFCENIGTIQRWVYVLTSMEVFPQSVYYIETIPVRLLLSDFLWVIIPTVFFGFVASLLAALRAARMDPLEALRAE